MAERRLAKQIANTKADFGFAITMNIKTGEVLALAQAPTVDSSNPAATKPSSRAVQAVSAPVRAGQRAEAADRRGARRLRHRRRRRPGSWCRTGCVPTAAALKDHFEHKELKLNMRGVVAHSSNIGMVLLARQMPKAQLVDYLREFRPGQQDRDRAAGGVRGHRPGPGPEEHHP